MVVPQDTRGGGPVGAGAAYVEELCPFPDYPAAPPLAARFGRSPLPKLLL